MNTLIGSLRVALATSLICVAGYGAVVLGIGQTFAPDTANGSLLRSADGRVIGSSLIAQKFASPRYFRPRPSAVDYNASGAGGSNLSPTNPELAERAKAALARLEVDSDRPAPADLVTASGSGLDPDISLAGALYQAPRIAKARRLDLEAVEALVRERAFSPGGVLTDGQIVNALELNIALDERSSSALLVGVRASAGLSQTLAPTKVGTPTKAPEGRSSL